jgi:hypothetical protein
MVLPGGWNGTEESDPDVTPDVFLPMSDVLGVLSVVKQARRYARISLGLNTMTLVIAVVVAALVLSGCYYSLPPQARRPTGVELGAMQATIAAWEAADVPPLGDICDEVIPRVHVVPTDDAASWCHGLPAAGCVLPAYQGWYLWSDYHPMIVYSLAVDVWKIVVHEMLHVLEACTRWGVDWAHGRGEVWGPRGLNQSVRIQGP